MVPARLLLVVEARTDGRTRRRVRPACRRSTSRVSISAISDRLVTSSRFSVRCSSGRSRSEPTVGEQLARSRAPRSASPSVRMSHVPSEGSLVRKAEDEVVRSRVTASGQNIGVVLSSNLSGGVNGDGDVPSPVFRGDVPVADQRGQLDAPVRGPGGTLGQLLRAFGDPLVEPAGAAPARRPVSSRRPCGLHPVRAGGEDVGQVLAGARLSTTRVRRRCPAARRAADTSAAHGRGVVGRPARCGRRPARVRSRRPRHEAVHGGQVGLAGVAVASSMPLRVSLVNLQKLTFTRAPTGQHPECSRGAEHLVLAAGHDDRADAGVLEAQALGASYSSMSTPRS